MRFRPILPALLWLTMGLCSSAQNASDFKGVSDSLSVMLKQRTGVESKVELWKVMKRGKVLDLYFTRDIADYPWRETDLRWLKKEIAYRFPQEWDSWEPGHLFCRRIPLEELTTPACGNSGKPSQYRYSASGHDTGRVLVRTETSPFYKTGLSGRHIALWQSHGKYYDSGSGRWQWQRAPLWRTVEDLYTQSYVLPFLIPMLENAGAVVMTPRERDTQSDEIVCDNDPQFTDTRDRQCRRQGSYVEKGRWQAAGTGFADSRRFLTMEDNPFTAGTSRKAECTRSAAGNASAVWTASFPQRGSYAVYVSYATLPESTACAKYTVSHLGGDTVFIVDQRMGGGTWIYLGTFEFEGEGSVSLDNSTPRDGTFKAGSVVSADAVRFGGGYGKVLRGSDWSEDKSTSGLPAYAEGAIYSEKWHGVPDKVWKEWDGDYVRDYASRGAWTKWLKDDLGIPFDLSLGFHSDAGKTPSDSIIGTLAIYTLSAEGSRKCSDGRDRMSGRHFADLVQSQLVGDIRRDWNPEWQRRQLWDRSYSESRTTDVPAMLLELLSHQNFEDMKYGLDPAFRFEACRSVYKGILKFLSDLYGVPYTVQPLPVKDFSVMEGEGGKAVLDWSPSIDDAEPTATPRRYVVHTRIGDGTFDAGFRVTKPHAEVEIQPGVLYSFKVVAENDGGRSFPSETLSIGIPSEAKGKVLIINNFTRISGPTWFDTPTFAGFEASIDGGVPWGNDLSYIGEVYQNRRDLEWTTNLDPGFGATYMDCPGSVVAGNTFDYAAIHGKALLELGYAFCSSSASAFKSSEAIPQGFTAIDLICGKQVRTALGPVSYEVFPADMRKALREASQDGVSLIVSGANVATDIWDRIYPVESDGTDREMGKLFLEEVLGIKRSSGFAGRKGSLVFKGVSLEFWHAPNPESYCVERCDAISPASPYKGKSFASYPETGAGAAVQFRSGAYAAITFGFPLEALKDKGKMKDLLGYSLEFINQKQ